MSRDDGSSLLGRTIAGKFELETVLGEGGTGTVYRARQLALDRTVALKVLRREVAHDKHFLERFKREARAASRLDHPNSVRVLDFGQDEDSSLYLVMELVQGRTLYDVIDQEWPLDDARIVRLLSQVLAALAMAHELGVIHRDLKPENIIVVPTTGDEGEEAEQAKVCDFGIAALGANLRAPAGPDEPRVTISGSFVGTPEYMSPEQVRGELGDQRSDIYSLGVVLYNMLTGRVPFRDPSPWTVALLHSTEPPVPPSQLQRVHPGLERVCLRALSKRPEDRYATAREMRAALRACLGHATPVAVTPPPARTSTATPMAVAPVGARSTQVLARGSRRPWLAVSGVIALAMATALAGRLTGRPHTPPPTIANASVTIIPAAAPPPAAPVAPPPEPTPTAVVPPPAPEPVPERPAPPAHRPRRLAKRAAPPASLAPPEPPAPPPPEPAPTPAAVAAPAPAPPPPAPPPRPRWDPQRATVAVAAITTTSAVPAANIRAALGRMPLLRCYRASAGPAAGTGILHLKIDGAGYVTSAALESAELPAELRACVEKAARALRIKDVDTGDASAAVTLRFTPS